MTQVQLARMNQRPRQQGIALIASGFEVGDVTQVEQVKATVGDDEPLPALTKRFPPGGQFVPGDNLVAKIHSGILMDAVLAWQRF